MLSALLSLDFSLSKTATVLLAVAAIASVDLMGRLKHRSGHYVFAVVLGTILSVGLMMFTEALFAPAAGTGPLVALGVLFIILAWRFLFGPWDAHVKATVLGTFIFWIMFHQLFQETGQERFAHLIAIGIAAIPAVVWCMLFLPYHKERWSVVLLMFFSGMLSTVPILFYDALVKHGVALDFLVFRIVPESFNSSVQDLMQTSGLPQLSRTLLTLFLSFLLVGLLEEGSKYWVLRRNGSRFFSSIDDAMQFAVLTAIGFAFAENITSSGYFFSFVKEFLGAGKADWGGFLGNVAGRSILTSMVHIVSTGVLGYFLGLAIFADPCLEEARAKGKHYWVAESLHRLLGVRRTSIFRTEMLTLGIMIAIFLHALSNFLVTLPDVLPGNPRTFGELLGSPAGSPLHYIALLLIPALVYVVGGFWLLTALFERKENAKERGHVVATEMYIHTEQ
ncbi:MAG: PrsW family glutamic-type intramembrane protease [Candidatus Peribacteraceae bacterium]